MAPAPLPRAAPLRRRAVASPPSWGSPGVDPPAIMGDGRRLRLPGRPLLHCAGRNTVVRCGTCRNAGSARTVWLPLPWRHAMPLVRIDLPAATSAMEVAAVSNAVHRALVEVFRVPEDDRFQLIGRRGPGELVCTPQYLGVAHSDRVVIVEINCSPGRSVALKEQLYARIAGGIAQATPFA